MKERVGRLIESMREPNRREIPNPNAKKPGESRLSRVVTAMENAVFYPSLGSIYEDRFVIVENPKEFIHKTNCQTTQIKEFPIIGVTAAPPAAVWAYERKDYKHYQCGNCDASQTIFITEPKKK